MRRASDTLRALARGALRALALPLAIAALSGCPALAPRVAPDDGPPSPVFETPGPDGAVVHWRYVPLDARGTRRPTEAEFRAARERCAALADDGGDATACLAERGFYPAQCSNGRDDDGDGLVDFPADPGCADAYAVTESPACDDGVDDDGDGLVDWDGGGIAHPDPDCADDPSGASEAPPPPRSWLHPF